MRTWVVVLSLTLAAPAAAAPQEAAPACALSPAEGGAMTGPCTVPGGAAGTLTLWEGGDGGEPIWIGSMNVGGSDLPVDLKSIDYASGPRLALRTPFGWYPAALSRDGDTLTVTYRAVEMDPSPADVQIIARAREILDDESVWDRADDRVCEPDDLTFSLYCAVHRATVETTGGFHHRQPALQAVRRVVQQLWSARYVSHRLMDFNNHDDTTLADIQRTLAAAMERVSELPQ